jgi:hypothetical protein
MPQPFGNIIVDHRNSPGLDEEQARRAGYEPSLVGEGKVMEADTMMCAHCNQPVIKNPLRTRERYCCMACGGRYICDQCNLERVVNPDYKHRAFRQIVEQVGSGEMEALRLGVRPVLIPTKKPEV